MCWGSDLSLKDNRTVILKIKGVNISYKLRTLFLRALSIGCFFQAKN